MTPQNSDESFFDFTFKSSALTTDGGIACVCLCLVFFDNIQDETTFNIRLVDFVKNYNHTIDVQNGVINRLIIILPATKESKNYSGKEFFENNVNKIRFSILLSSGEPIFLLYDKDGAWHSGNERIIAPHTIADLVNEIKLLGLYHIFESGHGILESGPSHHYILQNGFHADKFIRTANILTNSKYIDFIAIFLLAFVEDDDKRIYIDTSGIASLVYSINKLKNIFTNNVNLAIASFNSYSGISGLVNDGSTKIIISASTSGGLSKKLIENDFSPKNINILFYLNRSSSIANVLCDLKEFNRVNKTGKYSYFTVENEASCSFCANSSYPIKIVGEQFLPEELKVDTFSFDVTDRLGWITKFINQYFHNNIFKAHYNERKAESDTVESKKREIFIHFEKVFENMQPERLKRFFSSKLPNKIDALIYYSDNGSIHLKNLIVEQYGEKNLGDNIISDDELNDNKNKLQDKNILVVSSTINSGRKLVETSLKLRDINCTGICYFVGMSRTPDEYVIDITRKYIGFDNELGKDINPLVIADSIYISDINITSTFAHASTSSWEEEQNLFLKLKDGFTNADLFDYRINQLINGGLTDNLYLGDSKDNKLKLRRNFAFYLGTKLRSSSEKSTQAEVFFLINAILHNLRRNPTKKILQSAFHRHVIAPETFVMYNDGVIQASILRSATPIELNYNFFGYNMKVAHEMLNVLRYVFNNFDNEIGEATLEFLVALGTKRLQVIKKELKTIIESLDQKVSKSNVKNKELILALCKYIDADLKKEFEQSPFSQELNSF